VYRYFYIIFTSNGEVAEWSNAPVLKTGELKGSVSSNLTLSAIAKVAQLVEHDLAKVRVAGSNPVFRSIRSQVYTQLRL
jgi:DNA-binding phage protein